MSTSPLYPPPGGDPTGNPHGPNPNPLVVAVALPKPRLFEQVGKWVDSKGGAAHLIAGTWLFLLAAYGSVKPFHDFVLQVHAAVPSWIQEAVAGILPLIGFYKTWAAKPQETEVVLANPTTAAPPPPLQPKE